MKNQLGNVGITITGVFALSIGIAIQNFPEGVMIYVVIEELILESQTGEHSNIGTIGVVIGFVIMMTLDVELG